ncbi:hypothetical protein BKA70DRAFT_1328626 [Coprinopsis sp. MPI-PUGE-AT-0042]|nr:hypothetical protein BKA70DRAFT_1328626 [Coprinopsis sp. MPI-PUGE-AT-0042]
MTIIVLEYFELLELEKLLIWPSKWSLTRSSSSQADISPLGCYSLHNSALPSTSPKECHILFGLAAGTLVIAGLCADAVLYLRLYALSKQARLTKVVLLVNFAVVTVLCVMGIALFLRSETYIPSPNLLPLTTCFHRASKMTTLWLTIAYGALLYSSLSNSLKPERQDELSEFKAAERSARMIE